jgi:hypothetical protein
MISLSGLLCGSQQKRDAAGGYIPLGVSQIWRLVLVRPIGHNRHRICLPFAQCLISAHSLAQPSTPMASAPTPTSGVTVIPTPSPTEPRLDPVPQHCQVSNPTPHMSLPGLGPVIGASPVWADWPSGGPVIAHLSQAPPGVYEAPYGWAILKTIWEVGPNYTHPVTVRGHDLFDHHTPLLIQFTDSPPTADPLLDPQHTDHPVSIVGERWAEWGTLFVVPKAGCYVVEVLRPAGHWSIRFAAGA